MYNTVSGQYNVRGKEYMIMNGRMMPNVISRPQYYVVTYRDERLDGVVFQDEAIFQCGL